VFGLPCVYVNIPKRNELFWIISTKITIDRGRVDVHKGRLQDGWPKIYYFQLFRALEDVLSRCSRLHLHPSILLSPCGGLWPVLLMQEGLCPSSGLNADVCFLDVDNRAPTVGGYDPFSLPIRKACSLRISNKYGSLNSEQIPYEKCHYFEITRRIFKIRIASEVSNWRMLIS
jgi:hypothetical protein